MKKFIMLAGVAIVAAGCGTAPHTIDTTTSEGRIATLKISPQDFNEAADFAVQSMLNSPQFTNYLKQYQKDNDDMPLLMLGKVVNNTTATINMPVLTERIAEKLMNAGVVQVTTAVAGDGQLKDQSSADIRDLELDDNFNIDTVQKRGTLKAPNLSLSGAIIQQEITEGRTTEATYFFSLTLTDNRQGIAVWKGNREVGRQATQSWFGW